MSDLNRIQQSQPVQITDDSSQTATILNSTPIGNESALAVRPIGNGSIIAGISNATTNAINLGSQICLTVLAQNNPGNLSDALFGDLNNQVIQLSPGQSITIPINNISKVYVKMISGTGIIGWIAIT